MRTLVAAADAMVRPCLSSLDDNVQFCEGLAIGADGKSVYFTPLDSRDLYRVDASALRANPEDDNLAIIRAANSVQYLGEVRNPNVQVDSADGDYNGA